MVTSKRSFHARSRWPECGHFCMLWLTSSVERGGEVMRWRHVKNLFTSVFSDRRPSQSGHVRHCRVKHVPTQCTLLALLAPHQCHFHGPSSHWHRGHRRHRCSWLPYPATTRGLTKPDFIQVVCAGIDAVPEAREVRKNMLSSQNSGLT